ncbi:STAS domain-containing protein [Micromonospora sp. URMC 107]|uniref:STAS domain-containing protein n=1 Tax=Micromonospora sp. URMC 107 TaxID=3423418 RepID=UPI003F198B32
MSLSLSCDGSTKVVTVAGEIDMSNAHLLVELVEFLCQPPVPPITLDLAQVTYFGAHGISALLRAQELVTSAKGRLTVDRASPCVLYILGVTGMMPHLELDTAPTGAARARLGPVARRGEEAPLPARF